MKRAGCVGALALTLLGCGAEHAPGSARAPSAPGASASAATAPSAAPVRQGYLPEVDSALALISRLRALPVKHRVEGTVIERGALLARLKSEVEAELRSELVLGTTELLFALNTVPEGFEFVGSMLDLYTSQLAGFYDPSEKRMYLLADLGRDAERVTLWHELVHALQDQHYDLGALVEWTADANDRVSAVQSLSEGDATSAMMDAMLEEQGKTALDLPSGFLARTSVFVEGDVSLQKIPPILRRSVMVPYTDGIEFTHHLRRVGGWASVDAAWSKLPVSTEQILHPEKYLAGEQPESVALPPPPEPGATLAYHDVLGEQSLRLVFEDFMPARSAAESAADWAGDRVAVYTDGESRAVAWRVRFDDAKAALRGARAFVRSGLSPEVEALSTPPGLPSVSAESAAAALGSGRFCAERARRGPAAVIRRDRDVAVVFGKYTRSAQGTRSESNCAVALIWAEAVLSAR